MTRTRLLLPLASLLAPLAFAPIARAQVSDADRAAARELYVEGVRAQDSGRFAEALEKFQRAQQVFSAPTHLLHIAECEAALGKLVESAETYRTLVRTPLPPGSPNAFVQAQQQGNAELPQVEPRIPTVRLNVKPENVQGLQVQIDGQPMSAALVGVQRPIDPGQHTFVVYAPGYAKTEQPVTVREKETKDVTMTLVPTSGGIIYTPTPATRGNAGAPPPPYEQSDQGAPPPYQGPPERKPASGGFMIGPRLGVLLPGGNLVGNASASHFVGSGLSLGLEGGFRFARRFYIGAVFEHGFHQKGDSIDALVNAIPTGDALNTNQSSNYYGLDFVYISNPDGLAFYGDIGLGYRTMSFDFSTQSSNSTPTFSGGEAELGLGMQIKMGEWVRLIPKVSIAGGQYSKVDCSQFGSLPTGLNCNEISGGTGTITNQDTHTFLFFGATAFFDFARKHGSKIRDGPLQRITSE